MTTVDRYLLQELAEQVEARIDAHLTELLGGGRMTSYAPPGMSAIADAGNVLTELLRGARRTAAGDVEPDRYLLALHDDPGDELRHRLADAGVELAIQDWLPAGTAFVFDKIAARFGSSAHRPLRVA